MSLFLEWKKLKRTGYITVYMGCGLFASAFPLVQMAVRQETFLSLPGNPLDILMNANWQMIAMLNILVSICGACLMYHTEYAEKDGKKCRYYLFIQASYFLENVLLPHLD